MPDWFNRKRWERQLAWRAQVAVATHALFLGSVDGAAPDSYIGEAVYDSKAVTGALRELASGSIPSRPFVPTLMEAAAAVTKLVDLRPSWIDYCNSRSGLDPAAADESSEMARQYVSGDACRAWPRFDEAQAALGPAVEALRRLQPELADFCGSDIMAGRGAA
ncbi:hypothetical protein ACWGJW_13285 [Streptomyces nigrescens]|uniref:Uncharacterized protein n=1 Tax=Streptomyces caniferus TaxID=285557 RepID=A0A640RY46_9ACTN|nr:hypothetical protein [Streptomyces caniferus]GFE03748.1 hypothetical protein Scani_00160 [Streptomyces caniferus]